MVFNMVARLYNVFSTAYSDKINIPILRQSQLVNVKVPKACVLASR